MRAGTLRHRLTIQKPGLTENSFGELENTGPVTVATRWGSLKALSGGELLRAQKIQADVTHQVSLRYDAALAGLSSTWRILRGSQVFEILFVDELEFSGVEFALLCKFHPSPTE